LRREARASEASARGTAPAIPPGLAELAPRSASWQTSGAFDAAMGGTFWFDPASHTLYFHLLKG
jgi:hypothetical protein